MWVERVRPQSDILGHVQIVQGRFLLPPNQLRSCKHAWPQSQAPPAAPVAAEGRGGGSSQPCWGPEST